MFLLTEYFTEAHWFRFHVSEFDVCGQVGTLGGRQSLPVTSTLRMRTFAVSHSFLADISSFCTSFHFSRHQEVTVDTVSVHEVDHVVEFKVATRSSSNILIAPNLSHVISVVLGYICQLNRQIYQFSWSAVCYILINVRMHVLKLSKFHI